MFFTYVLLSKIDNKLYIGLTDSIQDRLESHNSGKVESTKNRRPLDLIYYEAYSERRDAEGRELFLKSGSGHKFLKKQLKYFFEKQRIAGWSSLVARKAQFLGSSTGNG